MEVVVALVAGQALVFVIAFSSALAVSRRVVLIAGVVIGFVSAIVAAVVAAIWGNPEAAYSLDPTPAEAFTGVLLAGFVLYGGWALGVAAATWSRSWAARRRAA